MAHCPQCGSAVPHGATVCPSCGKVTAGASAAQRTLLGAASQPGEGGPASGATAPPPERGSGAGSQTIVGMPVSAVPHLAAAAESARGGDQAARTIMGMPVPAAARGGASRGTPIDPAKTSHLGTNAKMPGVLASDLEIELPSPAQRTLLGVARPGIAPLDPMAKKDLREVDPAQELGATIGVSIERAHRDGGPLGKRMVGVDRAKLRAAAKRAGQAEIKPAGKRAIAVVVAAGLLAVGAVLFAVLWRSAPPLAARATVDEAGKEVLEVTCDSCPDGTIVELGGGEGEITGGKAVVAVTTPLTVGDNQMRVSIDRPGSGRDETVHLSVQVSHRVRPDLGPLMGQKPSLQVVVEAVDGTVVEIDGRDIPLVGGRAVHTIDVTDALTGSSAKVVMLERRVSYSVRPPDGELDHGEVAISVGIVPLTLFAPGPSIVIDEQNFVLAGRTNRGAQITAAGKPIPLKPDGTFAQVMNVSSVGATQIEVRATLPEKAPRLMKVNVRRVDDLKAAVQEFDRRPDVVAYKALQDDIEGHVGKSVMLAGVVAEARRENHQTVALMDLDAASGCGDGGTGACQARLVAGFDEALTSGQPLRAYGRIAGSFTTPGRRAIPELDVEFVVAEVK